MLTVEDMKLHATLPFGITQLYIKMHRVYSAALAYIGYLMDNKFCHTLYTLSRHCFLLPTK